MTTTVSAIYEDGVLKLKEPLDIEPGSEVQVLLLSGTASKRTPAEIMAEIASLPTEVDQEGFSGRDHDKVLYGENGAA